MIVQRIIIMLLFILSIIVTSLYNFRKKKQKIKIIAWQLRHFRFELHLCL
jgi:hypothetical protein